MRSASNARKVKRLKQLWFGLGILAALLAVCLGALCLLGSKNAQTAALLSQAQAAGARGDSAAAYQYSQQAKACWETHAGFIDIMMSHEETDDIHREFSDLLVFAEAGDREEFLSSCGRLLVMVNHLTEMERPLWRNIL